MTFLANSGNLIILGLTVSAIAMLGFIAFFNNPKSVTNRTFLGFTIVAILWGVLNFSATQTQEPSASLVLWRLVIFTAVWFCFSIFRLAYVFPEDTKIFHPLYRRALLPFVALVSFLTLTPWVFVRLTTFPSPGTIPDIENGPLIPLFGLTVGGLVCGAIYHFVQKLRHGDAAERRRVDLIMAGTAITFALLITFNFIFPTLFKIFDFIPYGVVFIFPFIACTAYAIIRYHLFNVKVIAAEVFSFILTVATLLQIVFSTTVLELFLRTAAFALVLFISILFVRSVVREVQQREIIQKQEQELEIVNKQQEGLLHFISHEVKGYLTESQAGFAAIIEGDYGAVPEKVKDMASTALTSVRRGVATVMDILDASNLKKGTVAYTKKPFDLRKAVRDIVDELKASIDEKGISIDLAIGEGAYLFEGDEDKIRRHVVRNLIDNAVKYTPHGTIRVELTDGDPSTPLRTGKINFSVQDSGVGITPEDKQNLFTEGGHGKDSVKINVHSTGYGLFIAKQVVEAHGGKVWAESEGQGKGSKFIVEFPIS